MNTKTRFLLLIIWWLHPNLQSQECETIPYNLSENEFFQSIQFIDENNGYIGIEDNSQNGKLIATKDGGLSWTKNSFADCSAITAIHFSDLNNGFIKTDNKNVSYKTTDGGVNWHKISHVKNPLFLNGFKGLNFLTNSKQIGFLLNTSRIYKTVNNGIHWNEVYDTSTDTFYVSSIFFINEQLGYRLRNSKLEKTTNGGTEWYSADFSGGKKISFVNSDIGFMLSNKLDSSNYGIYKTNNQGLNWQPMLFSGNPNIIDFNFVTKDFGYMITLNKILKVTDTTLPSKKDNQTRSITVFPNPTKTNFNIKAEPSFSSQYNLYNMFGEKILDGSFTGNTSVDISNLKNGVYFLKINNTNFSTKIIKE